MAGNLTAMIASIFSGSAVSTDPYFNLTTLLLSTTATNGQQNNTFLDSSTNNFTITRNPATGPNAPTQGTFSPFSQTGWSNYFDGAGDFINTPATGQFAPAGDFTIRFYFYLTSLAATNHLVGNYSAAATTDWLLEVTTGGVLQVFTNGSTLRLSQSGITANQWYYVTVTRTGTTITGQLNGTNFNTTATYTQSGTFGTATKSIYLGMRTGSTNPLTGYLSNVSLVDGSAIQTVPTAPLTDVTGTKLLTCQSNRFVDNSSSPNTLTIGGNTTVVPFSPFNPTSAWSASTVGGSGYFDGTGDYLTTPDNAAFNLGSSDFLIEAWVYNQSTTNFKMIMGQWNTGQVSYTLRQNASKWVFTYTTNGTTEVAVTGTSNQVLNAWTHLAVIRTGNTLGLFVNGTRETTASMTGVTIHNNTGVFSVGGAGNGGDLYVGYIGSSRLVLGTLPSGYDATQSTLTLPTAPFTSTASTSILLNFTNSGVYDATAKNVLETVGNAQVSTTQSKWSPTSMYFDGTADYLLIPTSQQLNLSSGSWTVECWVNAQATGFSGLLSWRNANVSSLEPDLYLWNTGVIAWYFNNANQITGTTNIVGAGWVHVAVAKNGSSTRLFVGGNKEGITLTDNNTYLAPNTTLKVGGQVSATQWLNGYLQDVRITKGYARYVEGTGGNAGKMVLNGTNTLALPTAAFPVK